MSIRLRSAKEWYAESGRDWGFDSKYACTWYGLLETNKKNPKQRRNTRTLKKQGRHHKIFTCKDANNFESSILSTKNPTTT